MTETNRSTHIRTSQRRRGQRLTNEERIQVQEKFLKSFAMNANVRAACMAAGIDRSVIYQWLEKDTEFTVRYHEAEKDADDVVRAAIFQRAIHGYDKPVVSLGKIVYQDGKPLTEKIYSDTLLALLARARMHEFREKQSLDVNANVTGSVQTSDLSNDLRLLTNEQLAQFKTWLQEAKAGQEQ